MAVGKRGKQTQTDSHKQSQLASAFAEQAAASEAEEAASEPKAGKKGKKERAGPRKRRRQKKKQQEGDDRSDDSTSASIPSADTSILVSTSFDTGNWLDMVTEWMKSKSLSSLDYLEELAEKRRWQNWAVHAAELERQRRIAELKKLEDEEERERISRRRWALAAIEEERRQRISQQFLNVLTNTQWFNETISSFSENYEVLCPYHQLGCKVTCNRRDLEQHLEECEFRQEHFAPTLQDRGAYEVVCPNAVLGCLHSCPRDELYEHLKSCPYGGPTPNEEEKERETLKNIVITQSEEERARRVADENDSSEALAGAMSSGKHTLVQALLDQQLESVLTEVHDEIVAFNEYAAERHNAHADARRGNRA